MPTTKKNNRKGASLDDLFIGMPHGMLVFSARWGHLIGLAAGAVLVTVLLSTQFGTWQAGFLLAGVAAAAGWIAPVRHVIQRRAWCALSRNRLYAAFVEGRIHSRKGRLPVILRVRPTKVGEKALVWCLAGISLEDFEGQRAMIGAACYARDARVSAGKRFSHLVMIEIIRRDTLAATESVAPSLLDKVRAGVSDLRNDVRSNARAQVPAQRRPEATAPIFTDRTGPDLTTD